MTKHCSTKQLSLSLATQVYHSLAAPSGLAGVSDTDNDSSIVDSGSVYVPTVGGGMPTEDAEALGDGTQSDFAEMGFTIEKATVTAKSRALKS